MARPRALCAVAAAPTMGGRPAAALLFPAAATEVPAAHVGHWAVNLLYVAPVLLTALAILVAALLNRGERKRSGNDG